MKKILLISCLSACILIYAQAQNCTSFSAGIQATAVTLALVEYATTLATMVTGGVLRRGVLTLPGVVS